MGTPVAEDLESTVDAASRGDTAALRAVYETLSPRVLGYLQIRGAEDPEGLTNEVFVRVLPRLAEAHGGFGGLRALAFTVAHGLLVDELRRRGRQPVLGEYDASRDRRTQPSAEEEAIGRLGEGTALELLELLPEAQRTVVLLRVLGELSVAETAAAVGRSEAAVKKVQAKALEALRTLAASEARTTNEEARR
ncbi:RNA polymerase sigma factor [Nocardioides sp. Soil774]|uniref:RNA polymerase sigma factor n=1 Tax=Nocardioides sp. Soil774 TaxID=1736408 RepID=UPI000701EF40|nr:RNA polymerase sigma factor [Nocardioides sp. Soil774]